MQPLQWRLSNEASAGTTHLLRHINENKCPKYKVLAKGQQTLNFNKTAKGTTLTAWKFDQETSRRHLAEMAIVHELPIIIAEYKGFRRFVNGLQPQFEMPHRTTMKTDCIKIFNDLRGAIKKGLEEAPGRISVTSDLWTSNQTIGYIFSFLLILCNTSTAVEVSL